MNHLEILSHYREDLERVEGELLSIFKGASSLLSVIGLHILRSGGKRLRPLFLLLSAELCGAKGDNRYQLAAIIEAIHTASLLHDDVIDNAKTRRGRPSANSQWGNKTVILVGDYLYSNALRLAVQQNNQSIMEALSEATTKMTEAEILQLEKTAQPDITIDEYYRIISGKTAVLIAAACRIGAILAGADPEVEKGLHSFGLNTGIAFQLVDDVLDYSAEQKKLGKKLGKDLEEGKITMPMILLLQRASAEEQQEVRDIINSSDQKRQRAGRLRRVIELFDKYDCIKGAMDVASNFVQEAKGYLRDFEDSTSKQRLFALSDYSLRRQR